MGEIKYLYMEIIAVYNTFKHLGSKLTVDFMSSHIINSIPTDILIILLL